MKSGTSTAGIETSPRWQRKQARKRRAEEARWKEMSGPVIVSYMQLDDAVRSERQGSDSATDDESPA